jgi:hypothetical protein
MIWVGKEKECSRATRIETLAILKGISRGGDTYAHGQTGRANWQIVRGGRSSKFSDVVVRSSRQAV